jgi:transcriptional regulator with XRE-family HTH domain
MSAGLSQREIADAIGASHTRIGRFERHRVEAPELAFLGAYGAVVGLDLVLKAYPAGDPIRDVAHSRLLARFRQQLVLADVQALERKLALKQRDGAVGHLVLLVADTPRNRRAIAAAPAAFAPLALRTRRILAELRAGNDPGGSGIVVM